MSPPAIALGEKRANKTIREYIKSWITEWDIRRLYGATDEIETTPVVTDYTENKDLERSPQDEDSS